MSDTPHVVGMFIVQCMCLKCGPPLSVSERRDTHFKGSELILFTQPISSKESHDFENISKRRNSLLAAVLYCNRWMPDLSDILNRKLYDFCFLLIQKFHCIMFRYFYRLITYRKKKKCFFFRALPDLPQPPSLPQNLSNFYLFLNLGIWYSVILLLGRCLLHPTHPPLFR